MAKWSIRRLRGTGKSADEKTTLNPEMRSILMNLDGAYEPRPPRETTSEAPSDHDDDTDADDER